MFDPLIDGKDRDITSIAKSAVTEHRLKVAQNLWRAIGLHVDALDDVATRLVQLIGGDALTREAQ